ncbi:hypothetical protein T459_24441 [Capsicum annuum]|uniref:NB-ARC domain-containing protein n=1 Tax=Capsicum annuum TaxID=4072 RepID=A0A2G2YV87_CAPAN|nr:hypothetical protein T459_24441 [Capsicum annuum]
MSKPLGTELSGTCVGGRLQVLSGTSREIYEELCESLQQVAKDIDRIQEESKKIQDHKGRQASTWSLARDTSTEKLPNLEVSNNMVGRDKEKKRVLEELRGGSSDELKIIPIVGMGGIGKTTLAKQVLTILRFSPDLMFVLGLLYLKNIM